MDRKSAKKVRAMQTDLWFAWFSAGRAIFCGKYDAAYSYYVQIQVLAEKLATAADVLSEGREL